MMMKMNLNELTSKAVEVNADQHGTTMTGWSVSGYARRHAITLAPSPGSSSRSASTTWEASSRRCSSSKQCYKQ